MFIFRKYLVSTNVISLYRQTVLITSPTYVCVRDTYVVVTTDTAPNCIMCECKLQNLDWLIKKSIVYGCKFLMVEVAGMPKESHRLR